MPVPYRGFNQSSGGFTLVELVIGIVTFSAVMTIIIGLIVPQASRSVDPIFQVKATELGQSMLNEISSKLYDENSDRSGGQLRCSEDYNRNGSIDGLEKACTAPANLGPEAGEKDTNGTVFRASFDDIDDYNGLTYNASNPLVNSASNTISALYPGYSVSTSVFYDQDMNGIPDTSVGKLKLIRVSVSTPGQNNQTLVFDLYRGNY